jgi:hypothetical protein
VKKANSFKSRLDKLLSKRVKIEENGRVRVGYDVLGQKSTLLDVILMAQIIKASNGDTSSASFLRDTSGNKLKDVVLDETECELFEEL